MYGILVGWLAMYIANINYPKTAGSGKSASYPAEEII